MPTNPRWRLLVWLPILATAAYIQAFSVDLPYVDDMNVISTIAAAREGTLSWHQLTVQHNEHRIFVPRILMLLLARISGYDLRWEMAASYLALCAGLWVLYRLYLIATQDRPQHPLAFLPVSLLFLGWRQVEGLLWGFHLSNTLALFFSLATVYLLYRGFDRDTWPYAAAGAGVLASFSSAFGLGVWPLGAIFLAIARREGGPIPGRKRAAWLAFWCFCAGATLGAYFNGYHTYQTPWPTGLAYLGANLGAAARYALAAVGGPLTWGVNAAAAGGLAILAILVALALLAPLGAFYSARLLPIVLVAALPLLSLSGLLLHRLGLGVEQAVSSRYVTFNNLLPLGIYICLLALKDGNRMLRLAHGALLVLLCVGIFQSYFMGLRHGRDHFEARNACRQVLSRYTTASDKALGCAFPDGAQTRAFAAELERYNLSLFRSGARSPVSR